MNKIYKQLKKLFPNTTIIVRHDIAYWTTDDSITYNAYIANNIVYRNSWSSDFETLKELDNDLNDNIKDYKKVYK